MGALTGILVVDFSDYAPGPYCTALLRSMGASVWKVERPRGARIGRSDISPFGNANLHWGKKSITIDLSREEGAEIGLRLAKQADVIVEGFRPGVMERHGLHYEAVRSINPKVVYCSISGFGQSGPNRDRPGHGLNFLAISGGLSKLGLYENINDRLPAPLADVSSGLFAAFGVVSALFERDRTGAGKHLDVAMADVLFNWATVFELGRPSHGDGPLPAETRGRSGRVPYYGVFEARDGKKLVLGVVGEDHLWQNLCSATGLDKWKGLDFLARLRSGDQLAAELRMALQQKNRNEWLRLFEAADVPATPVNTPEEAVGDVQYVERKLVFQAQDPDGLPISLLRNPILPPDAPIEGEGVPRLGENTFEILEIVGYSVDEIERLRASGVV